MTEFQYWASGVHRCDAEDFATVVSHISPAYIDWLEQRSALLRKIEEQAAQEEHLALTRRKPTECEIGEREVWESTTRRQVQALESLPADGRDGQIFMTWSKREIDCRVTRPGRVGTAKHHNTMLGAITAALANAKTKEKA